MQQPDPTQEWLKTISPSHPNTTTTNFYKDSLLNFADFAGKTPKQIIAEYNKASEKQFKDNYSKLLLAYTAHLQKQYPPNKVREQIDIIRSFFKHYNLPLGFGARAHLQFFFK